MSLINTQVKEFAVQAYHNGEFKEVTSESIKGKWSVFFFYPADFTFVCPTELGDLADNYAKFQEMGCEVYSVSTDTHFVHKAWADASETIGKIKYPMLADPTGTLTRNFEVMIEEEGLALRGSFVVNPEGVIKVQAAQFVAEHGDQVCPAKWQPGAETLTPSLDLVGKL